MIRVGGRGAMCDQDERDELYVIKVGGEELCVTKVEGRSYVGSRWRGGAMWDQGRRGGAMCDQGGGEELCVTKVEGRSYV